MIFNVARGSIIIPVIWLFIIVSFRWSSAISQVQLEEGPPSACLAKKEYSCQNGMCIPRAWVCDRENDCFDGTDEVDCSYINCPPTHFQCADQRCVPVEWRCDHSDDCKDGSDETNCDYTTGCGLTEWACGTGRQCIPTLLVCNGKWDCLDGSDEDARCGINECEYPGVYCDSLCVDLIIGYQCSCEQGYRLELPNNRSCVDINECATFPYPCEQQCINFQGSFQCVCDSRWYRLGEDGTSCVPLLRLGTGGEIGQEILFHHRSMAKKLVLPKGDVSATGFLQTGVGFGCCANGSWVKIVAKPTVAFGRSQQFLLIYGSVDDFSTQLQSEISSAASALLQEVSISKLEMDWRTGNIYYSTRPGGGITVCDKSMRHCRMLFDAKRDQNLAIDNFVLSPLNGLIFYIGSSDMPRWQTISRCSMDGSQLFRLSAITFGLDLIAVDELARKLFIYGDGKNDKVFYMNFDGSDRQEINLSRGSTGPPHITSMAISGSNLIYADTYSQEMAVMDKFSGLNQRVLVRGYAAVVGLAAIPPWQLSNRYLADATLNPCSSTNCSQLCLLQAMDYQPRCECAVDHISMPLAAGEQCILSCPTGTFACSTDDLCLENKLLCDGLQDCSSGRDEGTFCDYEETSKEISRFASTSLPRPSQLHHDAWLPNTIAAPNRQNFSSKVTDLLHRTKANNSIGDLISEPPIDPVNYSRPKSARISSSQTQPIWSSSSLANRFDSLRRSAVSSIPPEKISNEKYAAPVVRNPSILVNSTPTTIEQNRSFKLISVNASPTQPLSVHSFPQTESVATTLSPTPNDCSSLVDVHSWYCTVVGSEVGQSFCRYSGVLSACAYSCCMYDKQNN